MNKADERTEPNLDKIGRPGREQNYRRAVQLKMLLTEEGDINA